ncbi:hypothetical protein EB796_021665 [Bugula neritina]|uniref:Uncharacterized protein n=1 Tax=Bugula neritina TaxID=10212 RepID=A0A7J7J1Q2_BUGNE|nr:hypothetical protein EB796_021665 [Bugula neritina]
MDTTTWVEPLHPGIPIASIMLSGIPLGILLYFAIRAAKRSRKEKQPPITSYPNQWQTSVQAINSSDMQGTSTSQPQEQDYIQVKQSY